ncbi:MAG: NAD(P)H-binding protein, partial [Propionibacteriaceae bacterium]|nr:NAD(P)H-binding protein [Propionibacteriaceae bacterium]
MRILILGATGRTGAAVLRALPADVQAVAALRTASDVVRVAEAACPVRPAVVDIDDAGSLRAVLQGCDVVVNAIRLREQIAPEALVDLHERLVAAGAGQADPPRIVTVGGAGALRLPDGSRFWQRPEFPAVTLPRGRAHAALRDHLEASAGQGWAYLIPPPAYDPAGPATGRVVEWAPSADESAFLRRAVSYADFGAAVAS